MPISLRELMARERRDRPKRTESEVARLILEVEDKTRDRAYESRINALIATAEKIANQSVADRLEGEDRRSRDLRWDRAFHRAMDDLSREAGIRRMSWQTLMVN